MCGIPCSGPRSSCSRFCYQKWQAWSLRQWLRPRNEWKSHETARVWPHVPKRTKSRRGVTATWFLFLVLLRFPLPNGTKRYSPVRFGVCVSKRGAFTGPHLSRALNPKNVTTSCTRGIIGALCFVFGPQFVTSAVSTRDTPDGRHRITIGAYYRGVMCQVQSAFTGIFNRTANHSGESAKCHLERWSRPFCCD
ncbi:hypothetical protein EDB92DRAFT_527084 [Lactarius akahatsu]|uniref:Uncharacterized protein n=1 Tax=Lactarius akahatsu TaxID=416441 RepID=A0AAD4Q7P9_9AGAM|nr:hypothetical protein EDB92DRAFT_527084 [Lactarius akahatsu]